MNFLGTIFAIAGVRPILGPDGHPIIAVSYVKGRPFSVVTQARSNAFHFYDIEWSRIDQTLYHTMCGTGPTFYAEHGARLPSSDPFLDSVEASCVYCEVCEDHRPDGENDDPCEHVTWCHVCGDWAGPVPGAAHDSKVHEEDA